MRKKANQQVLVNYAVFQRCNLTFLLSRIFKTVFRKLSIREITLMTDNLRANQLYFNLFKETFESTDIFSCKNPVKNEEEFENLYLLYDPTHLL